MQDLLVLHKLVAESVESNEITLEEAEVLYDKMYKEQVDSLILDVYEAFENGDITNDEANAYVTLLTEAVKDKAKGKKPGTVDAIANALKNIPESERKAIEDSMKKVSKVAGNTAEGTVKIINGINDVIKSKKKDVKGLAFKIAKTAKSKVTKESVDDDFDLDAELALFESTDANKRYLDNFKEVTASYKQSMGKIKTLVKSGKYAEAKKEIADAEKKLNKIESEVNKINSDTADDVMAAIGNTLKTGLVASLIFSFIAYLPGIGVSINKETIGAGVIAGLIDTGIKAVRGDDNGKGFNVYKEKVNHAIKKEKDILNNMRAFMDKFEKKFEEK